MDKWMELRPAGKTSHSQTDSVGREQMPNFFRVNHTLSSHDYLVFLIKASPVPRIASGMEKWINRYWEKKHMNGHFPEKLGYLLKIKSWKGRMLFCDVTRHWIFRCQCPALDPKIPLRSFPSNSVGLVLGVAKPAGQHGDRGTANQTIFSWDALLDWPIPPSGVTYFKFKCIMALGSHHTPWKKKKKNTPSDGTVPCETVWPQALLPGREGMERGPLSPRPHLPYWGIWVQMGLFVSEV